MARKPISVYRNGGEGFCEWVEDFVCLPIYTPGSIVPNWIPVKDLPRDIEPETGRSYWSMWENQKTVAKEALKMTDAGRFIYRLLVFCWMRGEGKSLFVCLIQLWKFCCWPKQLIVLGANSKDQVKFVHFDIITQIILNSPKLKRLIGPKNIQEKEIRLRDSQGNVSSVIKPISSFSGIVSNITGYTFSEIFDLKNHKFFYQLDGSIRNIPNALGTIDSTVSDKAHPLYKLYKTWVNKKDPTLFFNHRHSIEGSFKDFWNPMMTNVQLESYREKFPDVEFARYFKNTWEAGSSKVFTKEMVEATHYIGVDSQLGVSSEIMGLLHKRRKVEDTRKKFLSETIGPEDAVIESFDHNISKINSRFIPISKIYTLETPNKHPRMCSNKELELLGETFKTDWLILAGIDRSDPMKKQWSARTIITIVAKGLPGSKNNMDVYMDETPKNYIYFLLHLVHVETASLEDIKAVLTEAIFEYDGIDVLGSERWGMWDIGDWCQENNIIFEPIFPNYNKQRDCFSELYTLYKTGMFKTPVCRVPGTKHADILEEEALIFDHDPIRKWYGSPEKKEKFGVQDDVMFALGWGIYAGRSYGVEDFRERNKTISFGDFYKETEHVADY